MKPLNAGRELFGWLGLGLLTLILGVSEVGAQVTLRGRVVDGSTGEPIFAANVIVQGTTTGVTTDFDGQFRLVVQALPVQLQCSFIGFVPGSLRVDNVNARIEFKLQPDQILIDAAEVVGERISEKQKQAPLTVETMDVLAIKEAPTGSFYEGLGNLKGVDLTSASLGFKIINTRGFNSTSPVRSLQLIDGVDNQSPGLNFSLGNFLGAPDLDVKRVDIVAGASSAFYGPGAFNGVINMETKDPFAFPGLSVSTKIGERNLAEAAVRWADYFENEAGDPVFGYKFNFFTFSAYDWEATNYDPVYGSDFPASNPGRYDAVNIYGDEYSTLFDFSGDNGPNARGLGTFFRTGYQEVDLVDYNTENTKASFLGTWRLKPSDTYESPELIYGFNLGRGTTVYQGDNRFSLRDISFQQHRVELRKKDTWFIRAYRTSEDAGRSFDPYATALRLQDEAREDDPWRKVYYRYWVDSIAPQVATTWPTQSLIGYDPVLGFPIYGYEPGAIDQWYEENQANLALWHSQVEQWTHNGNANLPDVLDSPLGHFQPGSPEFQEAFDRITAAKNNAEEQGTRFFDRSSLVHLQGEYKFTPTWLDELRLGGNLRRYTPDSDGTIFSDTAGTVITNSELGLYAGASRRVLMDEVILTATVRADKNQNFDWVVSPAASAVWTPNPRHFVRFSFSSALRNPTLADQYLFLDVGPATLVGNLEGADSLITVQSFINYRNSSDSFSGSIGLNRDTLEYFNIAPIQPEQVRSFELGYRTTIGEKIYVDASYYFSIYRNFIGYNIGLDANFIGNEQLPRTIDVYRYAANSLETVQTQGFSIGLNYFQNNHLTFNGNYSWNQLVSSVEDPIIPAFNTPEHKFNVGATGRDYKLRGKDTWGFSVNYRWVQGFLFEGSPQFTGFVPQYDLLDLQVNCRIDAIQTTFKAGASNLLENIHIETYGGPYVGRLAYISAVFDLNHRK